MNEVQHMRHNTLFIVIASLVLIAGLVTAGCTQAGSTGTSASSAAPATGSVDGNGNVAAGPGSSGGQNGGTPGGYTGGNSGRQDRGAGQGFMNESLISATATKLGVSEDTLKAALNSTANSTTGRPDFAAAAQQLGITQQQLTDAFGFPAAGFGNGTRNRGSRNGSVGQGPGGQQPG